jgi:fanconi anemia group J protein
VCGQDIEDLVQMGESVRGCPYFASRQLAEQAEIILCPYNYIIDPRASLMCAYAKAHAAADVRASMQIDIRGCVVVFDEAHNIEDAAREAASVDLEDTELEQTRARLEDTIKYGVVVDECQRFHVVLGHLVDWMMNESGQQLSKAFERETHMWAGPSMAARLDAVCAGVLV